MWLLTNILWKNQTLEIDGIDNDLNILERFSKIKCPQQKFLDDISKPWKFFDDSIKQQYNNKLETKIYDMILLNLSIHYAFHDKNGIIYLMNEINKRSDSRTNLMISFIDMDVLFKDKDNIKFNDGGYLKKMERNGMYHQMKYFYPWRHNYPMTEPLISKKELVMYLNGLGWYEKNEYQRMYYDMEDGYKELSNSITRLSFIKLNI